MLVWWESPTESRFMKFLQRLWKMRKGGEDDDKGMVSYIESVQSLGGRELSRSIRDGICVCVVMVVVVAVMVVVLMVAMRVLVLMVVVGIVLLEMVVRVSCIGVVGW